MDIIDRFCNKENKQCENNWTTLIYEIKKGYYQHYGNGILIRKVDCIAEGALFLSGIYFCRFKEFNKVELLKYRQNIKSGEYIQVLNLFYLCDKNLDDAIKEYDSISSDDLICTTEKKLFPFIWYVWGGNNLKLNKYKERFSDISTNKHFFFSKNNNDYKMIDTIPKHNELAKHTQGFPYNNITIGEQFKNLFI